MMFLGNLWWAIFFLCKSLLLLFTSGFQQFSVPKEIPRAKKCKLPTALGYKLKRITIVQVIVVTISHKTLGVQITPAKFSNQVCTDSQRIQRLRFRDLRLRPRVQNKTIYFYCNHLVLLSEICQKYSPNLIHELYCDQSLST